VEFWGDKRDIWFIAIAAIVLSTFLNKSFKWSVLGILPLTLFVESGLMASIGKSFAWWCPVEYFTVLAFVLIGVIYKVTPEKFKSSIALSFAAFSTITSFLFSFKRVGLELSIRNFLTGASERFVAFTNEVSEQVFDDGALMWVLLAVFIIYTLYRKFEISRNEVWALAFGLFGFGYFAYPAVQVAVPDVLAYRQSDAVTLAKNIYYEATMAKEPLVSQYGVAEVTMGRVRDCIKMFGGCTITGVVYARKQFSWTLESAKRHGKPWESTNPLVQVRWKAALEVATNTLSGKVPKEYQPVMTDLRNKCARYYKRTDNKGTSARGRSTFDTLIAIRPVGAHTYFYDPRRSCKK